MADVTKPIMGDVRVQSRDDAYQRRANHEPLKLSVHPHLDKYINSWYPEILATCFSLICLIALFGILIKFNGEKAPHLAHGVTLNAIIAILGTASKVSLIFAISHGISQLKWVWFGTSRARELLHAELFDDASRGPLGAFAVLCSGARSSLVAVGATLLIVALAYDPFVQQVIVYKPTLRYGLSDAATMTQAQFISQNNSYNYLEGQLPAKAASLAAYWTDDFEFVPTCPSGTCTWTGVRSLAWCSKCAENTAVFSEPCTFQFSSDEILSGAQSDGGWDYEFAQTCTVVLDEIPLEFNLTVLVASASDANELPTASFMWPRAWSEVYFTGHEEHSNDTDSLNLGSTVYPWEQPLYKLRLLKFDINDARELTVSSSSCSLDLCLQEYNLSVENSNIRRQDLQEQSMRKSSVIMDDGLNDNGTNSFICFETPENSSINASELLSLSNNSYLYEDVGTANFTFCTLYEASGFQNGMYSSSFLTWWYTVISDDWAGNQSVQTAWSPETNVLERGIEPDDISSDYLAFMRETPSLTPGSASLGTLVSSNVTQIVANLAESFTKLIVNPNFNVNGTRAIPGNLGTIVSETHVRWAWLALPLGLHLGGIAFIIVVAIKTSKSRVPLWKSSLNAIIYHGIDHNASVLPPLKTIPEMDRQAAATLVTLSSARDERQFLETILIKRKPQPSENTA